MTIVECENDYCMFNSGGVCECAKIKLGVNDNGDPVCYTRELR